MAAFFKRAVFEDFDVAHMGKMNTTHAAIFAHHGSVVIEGGTTKTAAAKSETMVRVIIKRKETVKVGFVGDENNDGSLPKYAELIEAAEKAIKEAKEAIAELEYNGNGKLNKEAAIAKKEAEIAAIEAELKIRQAEFEAELAELEALVDVEEEEEVPAE